MAKGARSKARKRNNAAKRVRLEPLEDARLQRIVAQMEAATGVGPTSLGTLDHALAAHPPSSPWPLRPRLSSPRPLCSFLLCILLFCSHPCPWLNLIAAVTLEPLAAPKKKASSARVKVTDSAMEVDMPMTTVNEGRVRKSTKAQQRRERSRSVARNLRK